MWIDCWILLFIIILDFENLLNGNSLVFCSSSSSYCSIIFLSLSLSFRLQWVKKLSNASGQCDEYRKTGPISCFYRKMSWINFHTHCNFYFFWLWVENFCKISFRGNIKCHSKVSRKNKQRRAVFLQALIK